MLEMLAGEIAAMIDIKHFGSTADGPVEAGLALYCLPQCEGGLDRRRRAEENGISSDRSGMVIEQDGKPRAHVCTICIEREDIELGVIDLPDGIRLFDLVPVDQLEPVTTGGAPLVGKGQKARIERA